MGSTAPPSRGCPVWWGRHNPVLSESPVPKGGDMALAWGSPETSVGGDGRRPSTKHPNIIVHRAEGRDSPDARFFCLL